MLFKQQWVFFFKAEVFWKHTAMTKTSLGFLNAVIHPESVTHKKIFADSTCHVIYSHPPPPLLSKDFSKSPFYLDR